jgi:Helix-turn-helix domain
MATVTQAYRFALDPRPTQRRALASHCGAARVAHNWGLALVKIHLDQHRTDPRVQVPWTLPELRQEWNRAKDEGIDLAGLSVDGVGSRSAAGDGEVGQDRDRCPQHAGDLLDGVAVLLAGGA